MRILNIEDDTLKHNDICRVINSSVLAEIDWVKTLDEGTRLIMDSIENNQLYDLIITDMYFPLKAGAVESKAGDLLIKRMIQYKIPIPVILFSTVDYDYPDILGCLHYSDHSTWKEELKKLLEKL